MANWEQLRIDADVEVFFCEPHSPWQRPSNEHMNGLLRQYFPKGTDLNKIPYSHLQHVAAEMNGRPRKILNWRTPPRSTLTSLQPPLDRAITCRRRPHNMPTVDPADRL